MYEYPDASDYHEFLPVLCLGSLAHYSRRNYWFITKTMGRRRIWSHFFDAGHLLNHYAGDNRHTLWDKWINGERLYGLLHILSSRLTVACLPMAGIPERFYWTIFLAMLCYMPTIALSNSVAYTILKDRSMDVISIFSSNWVWGTVGFIVHVVTNLSRSKANANQFYISAVGSLLLGLYAFTFTSLSTSAGPLQKMPASPRSLALVPFGCSVNTNLHCFFIFSMFWVLHCSWPICTEMPFYRSLQRIPIMPIRRS